MPVGVYERTKVSVISRFWPKVKVNKDNGCWEWQGAKITGYGHFWAEDKGVIAHRWLYEQIHGPVPKGFELDHLCRNRSCVNPAHLEIVTRKENCRRGDDGIHQRLRTHCPQGHPYNKENTYICNTTTKTPQRLCRTCRRERYQAKKEVEK